MDGGPFKNLLDASFDSAINQTQPLSPRSSQYTDDDTTVVIQLEGALNNGEGCDYTLKTRLSRIVHEVRGSFPCDLRCSEYVVNHFGMKLKMTKYLDWC